MQLLALQLFSKNVKKLLGHQIIAMLRDLTISWLFEGEKQNIWKCFNNDANGILPYLLVVWEVYVYITDLAWKPPHLMQEKLFINPELVSHSTYVKFFVTFATKVRYSKFWNKMSQLLKYRKWIVDSEGGNKEKMRKCRKWISLHFLTLSLFPLHFLFILSLSLHFLEARLPGCHSLCTPGSKYFCCVCISTCICRIGGDDWWLIRRCSKRFICFFTFTCICRIEDDDWWWIRWL